MTKGQPDLPLGGRASDSSSRPLDRTHLWLYIEEPLLPVAPGTDWGEVARTRRPPHRLAPDAEEVARKVLEELHDEGWTGVEISHQGWDDHPQVGRAWWISLDGIPPPGVVYGRHNARMLTPRLRRP
jgi:hypothetical protein